MKRIAAAVLSILLLVLVPGIASANSDQVMGKWRTVDSNTVKSYTFDYSNEADCHLTSFTVRADVSLGTVTSTSAVIHSIKWVYTFNSGSVLGNDGAVSDNYGHSYSHHDQLNHPLDTKSFTLTVGHTLNFNATSAAIVIDKTDSSGGCGYHSQAVILFNPVNPH